MVAPVRGLECLCIWYSKVSDSDDVETLEAAAQSRDACKMAHRLLGTSSLGASSFFTSATHPDACGENGLPLTPKAVQILGRFQKIKDISHKNLCTYLDLVRVKKGSSC